MTRNPWITPPSALICCSVRDFIPPELLPGRERRDLELSIRSHSALRIPEQISERERMCCNILRDADKIDIFRVNCDTPLEDIYNVTTEELKTAAVSPAVKDCFLRQTAVPRAIRRSAIDSLVGHICLTFELVYPISRQIAREQGYIDRLLAFPSDNPDTEEWFRYMRSRLWADSQRENPDQM